MQRFHGIKEYMEGDFLPISRSCRVNRPFRIFCNRKRCAVDRRRSTRRLVGRGSCDYKLNAYSIFSRSRPSCAETMGDTVYGLFVSLAFQSNLAFQTSSYHSLQASCYYLLSSHGNTILNDHRREMLHRHL